MKRLFLLAAVTVAMAAWAGELWIGTISSTDGGSSTNRCTTTPFAVPVNGKITVQCDVASAVGVDVSGCDGGKCLNLAAAEKFPTSTGFQGLNKTCNSSPLSDGGVNPVTYYGAWVSAAPMSGGSMNCGVYTRSGTE